MKIKALLQLNSLLDTYEHLTTTLLYGKDEIKLNDVSNSVMNNEVWKKDQHARRDTPFEALTTSGRKMNRQNGKRQKSHSESWEKFNEFR